MTYGLVQIIIDDSTDKVITGVHEYDRDNGGTLKVPSGTSFPGTPAAKELFWRTDLKTLYRRNDGDTAWEQIESAVAAHAATHQNGGGDEISVAGLSGQLVDDQPAIAHALGGAKHTSATLNELNILVSDATLDTSTASRPPTAHASDHTDGTDDVQNATAGQKGLATAVQITKLDGIESLADVTDATNVAAAGAVMESDVDAKGDIFVATADNAVTRLPVGTNTHVLTADSAEGSGVKWAAGGGGGDTVKVSSDDTTAGYVEDKIVVAANKLALSTLNPGANETRQITTGTDIIDKAVSGQITGIAEKIDPVEDDEVMIEDSEASDVKKSVKLGNFPYPKGHIDGFNLTRLSTYQIQISAGECRDSADVHNIAKATTTTVALSSSGANGLDTGSESSSTPYHFFICWGTSGICGLASAGLSPTLPSGYTGGYRLIGSWINDSSSNLMTLQQVGRGRIRRYQINETRDSELRVLDAGSASSWTTVYIDDVCPQSAILIQLSCYMYSTVLYTYAYIRPYGFSNCTYGIQNNSAYYEGAMNIELINNDERFQYDGSSSSYELYVDFMGWTDEV